MTIQPSYQPVDATNPAHIDAIATLWNAACGPTLAISSRAVRYNLQPVTGGTVVGRLAYHDQTPVGVILASTLHHPPPGMSSDVGWIDALAVAPSAQRQGIGSALLSWTEQWLLDQDCRQVILGASQRPFAPGLPAEVNQLHFFNRHGFSSDHDAWDVAANLAGYTTPATVRAIDGRVRPAQRGEEAALLEFLAREFPGRWRFELEEALRNGVARFSDYMLLWTERGVDGFCQLTFEDSQRPLERFFPYDLPRPWGQLGSVGVSADRRGRGYGAAVVDAGLRRLHNNGVNGCVIDWTGIVDFYAKFGFQLYRQYHMLAKSLGATA